MAHIKRDSKAPTLELAPLPAAPADAALALELSHGTERAAAELMEHGASANTAASYGAAMRYWAAWYELRRASIQDQTRGHARAWEAETLRLPVAPAVVVTFITDHAARRNAGAASAVTFDLPPEIDAQLVELQVKGKRGAMKLATLMHRISVLSKAHRLAGVANPCLDERVKTLLARTRTAYAKRSATTEKKQALTADLLGQLLATCDDSLTGVRDRALLSFAWATGGRRRSEVAAATMENLRPVTQVGGGKGFVYYLGHSKTNQQGQEAAASYKPLMASAAQAMSAWLAASGVKDGAIFRRVLRGSNVGPPLGADGIRRVVKARCAQAGLEGDFSPHSLRSGFATEAGRRNMRVGDAMAMTGHSSLKTFMGYYQPGSLQSSELATMLDSESKRTS